MCVCGFVVLIVAALGNATMAGAGEERPPSSILFQSGKDGYPRFRIPALVRTNAGTLLAICEGRKAGGGLKGDIDLVCKRSTDSGRTWSSLQILLEGKGHTLGNPCPVVNQKDGTLWLAFTRSHGEDTEEQIVAGTSKDTTQILVTFSKDDGKTWAPPRNLGESCRAKTWTWYGTGPGIGIQTSTGRLVLPCYHAEFPSKTYRSHMIFSDDHGKSWRRGDSIGEHCTECSSAERKNGDLVLIARTIQGKSEKYKAMSKDGGQTWAGLTTDDRLYDPSCQASLLRIDGLNSRWLFCGPAGPGRRNLTVRLSHDEGRTWPRSKLLRDGDGQYSSMAAAPDGSIGCLFDCWMDGNYQVLFSRFSLDWLERERSR